MSDAPWRRPCSSARPMKTLRLSLYAVTLLLTARCGEDAADPDTMELDSVEDALAPGETLLTDDASFAMQVDAYATELTVSAREARSRLLRIAALHDALDALEARAPAAFGVAF